MVDDKSATALDRLFAVIEARRSADPSSSYTAKLLAGGTLAITAKITEEAAETVAAALAEGPEALTRESADLLYHLCVLWADQGVRPEDVWAELARREGVSGIVEKASRGQNGDTE
ncbi:MAG: phosphoribosyl-ATP diphosphatase [Alphaproteobacteria bacterium]|nr:phosphoribosyl-ATP diphosphatase [Alphaproteobacteria bacterium]MCZ6587526.1 phosphoribosyl-ATP diphosphatase [Alphaproteobacteria bacterium]MCZ6592946.1 phosphoribosyl-ATP diphosphatase [Alphaproteobacteria bacterium]